MLHGIKCLIRSYAHIYFVLTPLLVKHLIHCSILETQLQLHKLIQPVETYKCDNTLATQIEQSRVTLSMAAKMLEKMRENKKDIIRTGNQLILSR